MPLSKNNIVGAHDIRSRVPQKGQKKEVLTFFLAKRLDSATGKSSPDWHLTHTSMLALVGLVKVQIFRPKGERAVVGSNLARKPDICLLQIKNKLSF